MTDVPLTLPSRVRDDDLPPISLSYVADRAALQELSPRQYMAWKRLLFRLHKYGQLPVGSKALAAICKVGTRAFESMMPELVQHMDSDPDGRWTHRDIIAGRGDLPVTPDLEVVSPGMRGVDPYISGVRRDAANRRHHPERYLRLVPGDAGDAKEDAKSPDFACKMGMQTNPDFAATGGSVAAAFASTSHGSIDRSLPEEPEEVVDRSIRAGVGGREADAKTACKPEQTDANGGCKIGGVDDANGAGLSLPPAGVDEAALIAALRAACGDRIPHVLLNSRDLAPLCALIAEGCELERDVVPAVRSFVAGLKGPLRTFGAKAIREKAIGSRDAALAALKSAPDLHGSAARMVEVGGAFEGAFRLYCERLGIRSPHLTVNEATKSKRYAVKPAEWEAAVRQAADQAARAPPDPPAAGPAP